MDQLSTLCDDIWINQNTSKNHIWHYQTETRHAPPTTAPNRIFYGLMAPLHQQRVSMLIG